MAKRQYHKNYPPITILKRRATSTGIVDIDPTISTTKPTPIAKPKPKFPTTTVRRIAGCSTCGGSKHYVTRTSIRKV